MAILKYVLFISDELKSYVGSTLWNVLNQMEASGKHGWGEYITFCK